MTLTRKLFDEIPNGEIFRVITTTMMPFPETEYRTIKFLCIKGRIGIDWAIYAGAPGQPDDFIRHYGDKVKDRDTIRFICPCDQEMFQCYRY